MLSSFEQLYPAAILPVSKFVTLQFVFFELSKNSSIKGAQRHCSRGTIIATYPLLLAVTASVPVVSSDSYVLLDAFETSEVHRKMRFTAKCVFF